jgi:hypothetical protein
MVFPNVQYLGPASPGSPTPIQARTEETMRELDSRTSDGIHVRLLWHPPDGHVSVAVHDTKTGEQFDLPVGDGDRAVDVFHHPYAYAGDRRGSGRQHWPGATDSALAA